MRGFESGAPAVPIRWYDELDSTNAEARRLAEAGEGGPLWIAARRQSAGRGRRGRAWETGEGNLAATLLVTTGLEPAEASELSFVAGIAVGNVVWALAPHRRMALKWPNDVLLEGAKVAGILIESGKAPDGALWLAIGVGINLVSAPEGLDRAVTCVAAYGERTSSDEALNMLSESLTSWILTWRREGFAHIRYIWLRNAWGIGEPCTAHLGRETLQGVAEGIDEDGALLLRLADGQLRRITAGDVVFGNG